MSEYGKVLDYTKFINEVEDNLQNYLDREDVESVLVKKENKENGISKMGVIVRVYNENIAPCIYLEDYYERYKNGMAMEEVLTLIGSDYEAARTAMEMNESILNFQAEGFENMQKRIFMTAVSYDMNRDILRDMPHIRHGDLAVTFRLIVSSDDDKMASVRISYREFASMNMSMNELYETARKNTERMFPAKITEMGDMLSAMTGEELAGLGTGMYVLTNDKGINGATCMFYDDVLDNAKKLLGDYYILPSSRHEVLLLQKESGMEPVMLSEMVKEINGAFVTREDFLSDAVYEYDEVSKEIHIADGISTLISRDEQELEPEI